MHDDFGYLFSADTFAQGRLANPPHPMARFLETEYIVQEPTFSSIYPPGPGLILAAGQVLGHPWIGVLISGAAMGIAVYWFLACLISPHWALAMSLLCGLRYFAFSYWSSSYVGGPLTFAAGALLAGSLIRWLRAPSPGYALLAALAWSIAWLHRPYESMALAVCFSLPFLLRCWKLKRLTSLFPRLILPALPVIALFAAWTLAHNRAVTGDPLKLPYQLSRELQGVPQTPIIQAPVPYPARELTPEQRQCYLWPRQLRDEMFTRAGLGMQLRKPWFIVLFYCGFTLLALSAIALKERRNRWVALSLLILAGQLAFSSLYITLSPNAAAGTAVVIPVMLAIAARRIRNRLRLRLPPARAALIVGLLLAAGALEGLFFNVEAYDQDSYRRYAARDQILRRLQRTPGNHLVLVRYGPTHDFRDEWVYNRAAVDAAKVVWVRFPDDRGRARLFAGFPGRRVWIADVDAPVPRLAESPPATSDR
jgi:hypothetical protein